MDVTSAALLPATELVRRFREGELTPLEVHDDVQRVIARREPTLNALHHQDLVASRAQAARSTERWARGEPVGPLDGIPVTLKENVAQRGVPMPSGTAGVEPRLPVDNAPITDRVLESGAVVVGSTVMPDWGMLSSGVSSAHGITRSPWHPEWTTGGSSSGAGAAAAGGYGPLHVGTDIGGSLRLPATWLGLVTLKPSAGRVPLDVPYLGRAAGPLTRTVADAALLMSIMSRPDDRDWTSLPPATLPWDRLDLDVRGLRVGLVLDAGCGADVDPEVRAIVEEAAGVFATAGALVEPVAPFMEQRLLDDLDLFWRVRSWRDLKTLTPEAQARVLPYIVTWCQRGADVTGTQVFDCYESTMAVAQRTVAATAPFDVVLSPVAPVAAFAAESPMPFPDDGRGMAHIGFTAPYNMSGQPAASINAGFTRDGRPVGVQIAGRRFDDVGVLRAASWFEKHRPGSADPIWPDDLESGGV